MTTSTARVESPKGKRLYDTPDLEGDRFGRRPQYNVCSCSRLLTLNPKTV